MSNVSDTPDEGEAPPSGDQEAEGPVDSGFGSGAPGQPAPDAADAVAEAGEADGIAVDASVSDADDGASGGPITVEDLVVDLERVSNERDEYLDSLRRLQAEFENYRKAVAKREADAIARANNGLVAEMLPVLDACDSAVANGAADVDPVRTSLIDALTKQGLERFDPDGEPFNPEQHEAVMHEDGDGADGPVVAEVLRVGYGWKGNVVRPAMVKTRG